jgi:glycosyltransferase involved in cell wall biosynthesis
VNRDGETGLTVAPGDVDALGRAIAVLAADRDLRQRMGAAGRARVLSEFSMERMRTAATMLYREVAGDRVFTTRPAPV